MARRAAVVLLGGPIVLGAIWYGGIPLALLVVVLAVAGAEEFRRLARAAGLPTSPALGAGALAFPLLAAAGRWDAAWSALLAVAALAAGLAVAGAHRPQAIAGAAADLLGAVYLGGLFAHVIVFRDAAGFAAVLAVVAVVWVNDIAAYFVGVAWGRRPLAPALSPGKSLEGLAAGLVAATLAGAASGPALGWPVGRAAVLGLAVAAAAVAGDLWESVMKRSAGVKDSGDVLPGHGGILDRFDALLFGVPVGYYLWRWLL
ncbi:MAG: phosphatidate cytidylyltransferase [Armatimonadota bacterium]|nr:phosphatidate cytidylyltransferase [Armatimonadota bacterium]MDR7455401.1 phosphatidate cytidylyltransferase [Armatimonadota bacterium]